MMKKCISLIAASIISLLGFFPPCLRAEEPTPLKDRGIYTDIIENFGEFEAKKFVNFLTLYRGSEEEKRIREEYAKEPILKRFAENLIENLDDEIVFISSFEAEYINRMNKMPYSKQIWDAFADTLVERYKIAKCVDYTFKKVRDLTSISYTSENVRTRAGLLVEDSLSLYLSARGRLGEIVGIFNEKEIGLGVNRKLNAPHSLLYLEGKIRLDKNESGENDASISLSFKKRF